VQAKDANDQDIELDPNELLRLLTTTNEEYGTFIDKNRDTLRVTPVTLSDVLYSDANQGTVLFAAVKKNPETSVTCSLKVELQSDPTKKGEKEIVVLEQTLRIVMNAPREVQPVIPPTRVNAPRPENRKEFTVRITRGGAPIASHPFAIRTDYVDSSGGHDHVSPRRTENRDNYGHFILRSTSTHYDMPYTGETQANGEEAFDYVASIFADRIKIRVDSRKNTLLWDTVSVAEKVPNLVELGFGEHYELVGTPNNHAGTNDPCRRPPPTSQHFENHFGTQALLTAIQTIAASYSSLHAGIRLRINDMSLEFGGLFDANNNWNVPHREHRKGINGDIGTTGIDSENQCVSLAERDLRSLIREKTGIDPLRETDPPHFHIYVREN